MTIPTVASEGSTTIDLATLSSSTANFVTEDVGKVIVSDNFPTGTTIVPNISSTVVQTSAAETKTTTKKPVAFSILVRNPREEPHFVCLPHPIKA